MAWYKHPTNFSISTNGGTPSITQLDTAWATWEADANVHWQRASSQLTAPAYLVLKRKDGSPGRIIFTCGTAPASNYVGYNESGVSTYLYMGFDPIATSDVPADYSVNGGALFGSPSNLGRLRSSAGYYGTYTFRLYCNAAADTVWMWGPGGSINAFAWGKLVRTDGGAALDCYHNFSAGTPMTRGYWPSVPVSSSYSTTSNMSSLQQMWAFDTAANEGASQVWQLLMDTNTGGSFAFHQGNYAFADALFSKPNGIHRFAPAYMVPCIQGAFARPSFATVTSRYWGYGAPRVVDHVWLDNASATRGYYLGYTATPSSDLSMLSLLNETF